jgi:cytosine/adenosine deaminase-related metal-dependent hydrolase
MLCAEIAERHDTGIHTHLLETSKQAGLAQARYGTTMVRHLDELGVLSDRWSCAHSIWLTDDDIERMAERKAVAVLNPESNDRLGTGLARAPDLLGRGVPLALGTDGSGANDNLIMHEAMRAVAVAHRSSETDRSRWITAGDVLHMATTGGAAALRHQKLGRIAPGFAADLVVYRLNAPWWVPVNDIVNQMVFAETGASVDTVMIDGRVVVANGAVTTFDVDALLREVRSMSSSLRKRNADLFDVAHDIAEFVP